MRLRNGFDDDDRVRESVLLLEEEGRRRGSREGLWLFGGFVVMIS